MNRRNLIKFLTISGSILVVILFHTFGLLVPIEGWIFENRMRLRGVMAPDPRVVLVSVDQKSVDELGRFPWTRDRSAQMIEFLTRAGARVIAFDILFTEDDPANPDDDDYLGRAAEQSGRSVFAMLFNYGENSKPVEPAVPIPSLQKANIDVGFVNNMPESDGVTRRLPLWVDYNGTLMPSLALAAYAAWVNKPPEFLIPQLKSFVQEETGGWNMAWVNFSGWRKEKPYTPFRYHSFSDVLRGKKNPALFKDKIVIVGGTLPGLFDLKAVPTVRIFPGPEIQANMIENLIRGRVLREVPSFLPVLLAIFLGLMAGLVMANAPVKAGVGTVLGWIFLYFGVTQVLYTRYALLINYTLPTSTFFLTYLIVLVQRLFAEERIKGTWSQYMSPDVIDLLIHDPSRLKLGGEERPVSAFFSDVAGFTQISETMRPSVLVGVLNEYLLTMTDIIFKHGGLLDKYVGDMIVALWNAPLDQDRHAIRACLAALDQVRAQAVLQKKFTERGWPALDFRVGISTGQAVVGNMGSERRFTYTAIGDTVNLASRLEGVNKVYGTRLMISESTFQAAKDEIEAREVDLIRVQGKTQPIRVYELLAKKNALSPEKREAIFHFHDGLRLFRDRRFEEAAVEFTLTRRVIPTDGPSEVYLERCRRFQDASPPPDWDGVYVMTSK